MAGDCKIPVLVNALVKHQGQYTTLSGEKFFMDGDATSRTYTMGLDKAAEMEEITLKVKVDGPACTIAASVVEY